MKRTFWILFFDRGGDDEPKHAMLSEHNCIADFRDFQNYLGYTTVEIDMEKLKQ